MLAPPGELAPPPRGNPGSATEFRISRSTTYPDVIEVNSMPWPHPASSSVLRLAVAHINLYLYNHSPALTLMSTLAQMLGLVPSQMTRASFHVALGYRMEDGA